MEEVYVNAQSVIDIINEQVNSTQDTDMLIRNILDRISQLQKVEIVHCEDCILWDSEKQMCKERESTKNNDYCSFAIKGDDIV
jgi:hypothetical protein